MATKSLAKRGTKPEMKYRKKASCEFRRLPFMGKSCWDVPATGGYQGGCEAGKYAAIAYLKYLRTREDCGGGTLQHIVFGMLEQASHPDNDHSFRGQIVGFFSTLDYALHWSARSDARLDEYNEGDLAAAMTRAINFDEKAWLAALEIIDKFNGDDSPYIAFRAYRRTDAVEMQPAQSAAAA